MMKTIIYIVLIGTILALIAGGTHLWRVNQRNKKEMAPYAGDPITLKNTFGKTLVIYYSLSGHTKQIAEIIQDKTNADIYEIKTVDKIDTTPWFALTVRSQNKSGQYPAIIDTMPDLSQYDTIFFGAPVWWYTLATPAKTFLTKFDFQNKRVAPFSTQGSNYGSYFTDFNHMAKNAQLLPSASFNNLGSEYDAAVANKITVWLNSFPAYKK